MEETVFSCSAISKRTMVVRAGTLLLGGALGVVAGCPFELERGVSCGDGWWDPQFEDCDPRDVEVPYLDACREQGIEMDATCDPQTCTIRPCAPVCGDGVVLGDEECEVDKPAPSPCSDYPPPDWIGKTQYASGMIEDCSEETCKFGRDDCNCCGDGVLDEDRYEDYIALGDTAEFQGEVCDGDQIDPKDLEAHCESEKVCGVSGLNGDVVVYCEFECEPDCSGIIVAGDISPGPGADSLHCCLAAGSPCPLGLDVGVPDLPCCTWLDDPAYYQPGWVPVDHCSDKDSSQDPPFKICSN
jgi:hypothetical protein